MSDFHMIDEINFLHKSGGTNGARVLSLLEMDLGVFGEAAAIFQSKKKTTK